MFTNDVSKVNTILNFRAGSTKHLAVANAVFPSHSNRHNVVKANRFTDFINRQRLKLYATHITSIVALDGNFLHIRVIKHKVVIGTLNAFARVVPVFFTFRETTRRLFAFLERTTALVGAKLLGVSVLIRKAITAILTNKSLRVFSEPMCMYTRFITVPSSESSNGRYSNAKVLTDFFYGGVFLVVESLKIFLGNFSRFSSLHGLIIAQAIPNNKGSTRLGYAYGLKNINIIMWSARTGYSY